MLHRRASKPLPRGKKLGSNLSPSFAGDSKRARRADRQRRFRERQRERRIVVQVELGEAEIDFLIRSIWLDEREDRDKRAIGDAIRRMLEDSARG